MADTANYGNVKAEIGTGAMAIAWTAFAMMALAAWHLLMMILSMMILERLGVDD